MFFFFFSSRRRHTRLQGDWSSDVCSSDLVIPSGARIRAADGVRSRGIPTLTHPHALVDDDLSRNDNLLPRLRDNFQASTLRSPPPSTCRVVSRQKRRWGRNH